MSKKINVKLIDQQTLKFELTDDAQKGDYVVLSEIEQISFDEIANQLNERRNDLIKQIWEREKNNVLRNSEEYKELDDKLKEAQKNIEVIKLNVEREYDSKINELNKEKLDLNHKIESIQREQESFKEQVQLKLQAEISNKESELKSTHMDQLRELENKIIEQKSKIETLNNNKQLELENKKLETERQIEDKYKSIIEEKNNTINELENRRNLLNIKEIGEELENFMKSEASNNLSLPNTRFIKSNDVIDGTKPDFIFDVLSPDGGKITSVTIEAKSETLNAKTKKKNDDHIEKLNSDRNKQGSEYALLVTELEKDDEFIFKKVGEYQNMYMVRPRYFIPFLQLIYNVSQKEVELNNLQIDFKDKQEILEEFESFKNFVIENTMANIAKNIEEIQNQADKAIVANTKIIDRARIMSTHMATLENKFMTFKIQKLVDKM